MKNNKLVFVLICCVAAVFFLTGVAIACQAAKLGKFVNGTQVEGIVYDYKVQRSSYGGTGGYHCFLSCRYVDEASHNWITEFQYNFTGKSHDDAENCGKKWLNKPVKLYIKGSDCVSEIELNRYVPYVGICVALFVAGAVTVTVPLIVKAVKKRRAGTGAYREEDYLI